MPIEIRELVIRANVEPAAGAADMGGCGATNDKGPGEGGSTGSLGSGGDDMVQECVREVLRILEARRER